MKAVIIDGYVDEPACLGVPPYISPYPRYVAGALRECGAGEDDIFYITIDKLRSASTDVAERIKRADAVIVIAGMTVPGKYLRAEPIKAGEIESIFSIASGIKILGGPVRLGFGVEGGKAAVVPGIDVEDLVVAKQDIEAFVYDLFSSTKNIPENIEHRQRTTDEIARWAVKGAFVIKQHPDHPNLMCELETYRGCGRLKHCSFCTEDFYGSPDYRAIQDVIDEVEKLHGQGARHFRIGRQPDLLSYHSIDRGGDIPEPNPQAIETLYKGIRNVAPELKVLHMDNANPGTVAAYPEKAKEILRTIVKYHTPGDVAALGMETADPAVVAANDLKAMPDDVFEAIRVINEIGGKRGESGLPELLPGLNFVHGLKAETKKTFELNYDFLKSVLDEGLLVRRINIRQVMPFPNTPIYGEELVDKNKKLFLKYKEKVRKDIDLPMLRKVVPIGTVLKDIMCEVSNDKTFGRQLGSYPLLVGIPAKLPTGEFIDVTVTGHGHRSITGIPYPLEINSAPVSLIHELPGASKKQITDILRHTPYRGEEEFLEKIEGAQEFLKYIKI